ncbi:DNA repair protein RadC [Streptococcus sp. E17BB]|uniref:RadC family protein n=1 Tax=Streptococcus sp. E17BB TaxID=3278714 RepID=UPI00359DA8C1
MYSVEFAQDPLLPRERLLAYGAEQLSNQELLAILLRTGTRGEPVFNIANQILACLTNLADLKTLSVQELQALPGIGQVKAIEIKAIIELASRIKDAEFTRLDRVLSSQRLAKKMMAELGDKKQEHLVALYLDSQNKIIHRETVFIGGVRRSVAEPREILYHACRSMATSVIVIHNHPSGVCTPSPEDKQFTQKLKRCCDDLGVILLDHLIVGKRQYYSFREEGDVLN